MDFRPAAAPRNSLFTRRRVAIAATLVCFSLSPAWAAVSVTGSFTSEGESFSVANGCADRAEVFDDFICPSICHAVIARNRG